EMRHRPPSLVLGFRLGWFGRRAWHGDFPGLDLRTVAHTLDAVDDDPVLGVEALQNDLQATVYASKLDVASLGDVLVVLVDDDVHELEALIGPDCSFGDQHRFVGLTDGDADTGAHALIQNPVRVRQDAAHLDRPCAGVDPVIGEI